MIIKNKIYQIIHKNYEKKKSINFLKQTKKNKHKKNKKKSKSYIDKDAIEIKTNFKSIIG